MPWRTVGLVELWTNPDDKCREEAGAAKARQVDESTREVQMEIGAGGPKVRIDDNRKFETQHMPLQAVIAFVFSKPPSFPHSRGRLSESTSQSCPPECRRDGNTSQMILIY